MRALPVHLAELATALDQPRSAPTRAFFDLQTGDIEYVPFEVDDEAAFEDIFKSPHRFLEIPRATAVQRHRARSRFIDDVTDAHLRLRLAEALDLPKGALPEFERILRQSPPTRDAWLRHRDATFAQHARSWLLTLQIVPIEAGG